jgi:hypothetical protein
MDDTLIIVEIPWEATAINKAILHIHLMVTVDMTRHRKDNFDISQIYFP